MESLAILVLALQVSRGGGKRLLFLADGSVELTDLNEEGRGLRHRLLRESQSFHRRLLRHLGCFDCCLLARNVALLGRQFLHVSALAIPQTLQLPVVCVEFQSRPGPAQPQLLRCEVRHVFGQRHLICGHPIQLRG